MKITYFRKNTAMDAENKRQKDRINEGIWKLLNELKKYHERCDREAEKDYSEKKARALLEAVFKERMGRASRKNMEGEFPEKELEKEYRHSIKLLEKFLDKNPEAVDDYVELIETIGKMARAKGQRKSIAPVLCTTLKIIDSWDLKRKEKTYARLHVLEASIDGCIGMIATLNRYGLLHKRNIYEKVAEIYSAADDNMIEVFLTRGLNGLKRYYSREIRETIIGIFSALDGKIIKSIKFGKRFNLLSDNLVDNITKLNERLANAIGSISEKDELYKLLNRISNALERDDGLVEIGRILKDLEDSKKETNENSLGRGVVIRFPSVSVKSQN